MNRNITFGHFVDKYWAPYLRAERSPTTARTYGGVIRRHAQQLDNRQVRAITSQDLLDDVLSPIKREGRLSPGSLRGIEAALGSVFELARTKGVISKNPMAGIRSSPHESLPFTPFTDDQLMRIESCLPYYPYGNVFGMAMHSDLRRNQILGITAEDFPSEIQRNRVRITFVVLETSTWGKSVATRAEHPQEVTVSDKARTYLENEYRRLSDNARLSGHHNEHQLLFADPTGGPVPLLTLGKASRAIREMSCVPSFSLRNLRRTYRLRRDTSEVL